MPEPVPLNAPWPIFPTPEIADDLIIEILDSENTGGQYTPLPVGSPHPNARDYPGYKLVKQTAISHSRVQRTWSTQYSNQDLYNYDIGYIDEHASFPIFIRRYLVRRDQYAVIPTVTPMTGVFLVKVTNGGTGYNPEVPPAVSFSGGAGSGAAATALVDALGVVQWVRLTSEGTGYTSAPTVTIAAPVSGVTATATSYIQGNTVVLTNQKVQELPADDPRMSLFVLETRIYKLLNGPEVFSYELRPDGTVIGTSRQEVLSGTIPQGGGGVVLDKVEGVSTREGVRLKGQLYQADGTTPITDDSGYTLRFMDNPTNAQSAYTYRVKPYNDTIPAVGSDFGVGSVIDYREQEIKGADNVIQIITSMATPEPWTENPVVVVTFPGIFKTGSYSYSTAYDGRYQPPWPGDGESTSDGYATFYQLYPRNRKVVGRVVNSFSLGPSGWVDIGWSVYTPGVASRIFSIPNDTVHGPIVATETTSSGTFTIENIPASTPSVYNARQILTFPLGEERYKGEIYWRKYLQVSEATSPNDFPEVQASLYFRATGGLDITAQPNPGGSRLSLVSDGADTRVITIFGQKNTATGVKYSSENVTLSGTTPVFTDGTYLWYIVTQVHAASSSASRNVTVRIPGSPAVGSYEYSGVPANGDTITVGPVGLETVYTYRSPARLIIGCPAASSLNAGGPGSYVSLTLAGVAHYFWFDVASGNTDPAPGGTGHEVDVAALDPDTAVATALRAKILADISAIWTSEVGGNAVTITGIALGAGAASQDAGNDFAFTVVAAGTAQAANQIRTTYTPTATAATATNVAEYSELAFNLTGVSGVHYSTATVQNPYLEAESNSSTTLSLESRDDRSYGTWTTNKSSSVITATAIVDGANGPTVTVITANNTDAYNDISFQNVTLVLVGAGWSDEESSPYGAIVYNMPAYVGTITTDAIQINVTNKRIILRMIATGTPPLPINYQTSADGAIWSSGTDTLNSIGNRILYDKEITETSVNFIRFRITNTSATTRAVHLEVFFDIT